MLPVPSSSGKHHSIFAPSGGKRTRSQLPDLQIPCTLQDSPFKQARKAVKKGHGGRQLSGLNVANITADNIEDPSPEEEDEILLSPRSKRTGERLFGQDGPPESKRAKLGTQGTLPALFARQFAKGSAQTPTKGTPSNTSKPTLKIDEQHIPQPLAGPTSSSSIDPSDNTSTSSFREPLDLSPISSLKILSVQPTLVSPLEKPGVHPSHEAPGSSDITTKTSIPDPSNEAPQSSPLPIPRMTSASVPPTLMNTTEKPLGHPVLDTLVDRKNSPLRTPAQETPSKSFKSLPLPKRERPILRAQSTLNNLSLALDKLAMPPPSMPAKHLQQSDTSSETHNESTQPENTTTGNPGSWDNTETPHSVIAAAFKPAPSEKWTLSKALPGTGSPRSPNSQKSSLLSPTRSLSLPPMRFNLNKGVGIVDPRRVKMKGIFPRKPFPRASKQTDLETVEASPVKQPTEFSQDHGQENGSPQATTFRPLSLGLEGSVISSFKISEASPLKRIPSNIPSDAVTNDSGPTRNQADPLRIPSEAGPSSLLATPTGGEAPVKPSEHGLRYRAPTLNSSRRASMAFSSLTQSIPQSLPKSTEKIKPKLPQSTPAQPEVRQEIRSLRRHIPSRMARAVSITSTASTSKSPGDLSQVPFGGLSSPPSASGKGPSSSELPKSLGVMPNCRVFVDVRTEEGEDAGALFVDMLRSLGAKVTTKVRRTCTHVVYKNGLASTLTRLRLLPEPRPRIVGIAWVVECAEKLQRVDESRYVLDIDSLSVFNNKRRRSIMPRQLFGVVPDEDLKPALNDRDKESDIGDTSQITLADQSSDSISEHLTPLERARQRTIKLTRP